jgi:integrase
MWWVYKTVPPSLRKTVGKRTLRRSLGTSDLAEALRLRPTALAAFAHQLDNARNRAAGRIDLIAEAAAEWRRFAALAVDDHGQPLPEAIYANLISEKATELEQLHGPVEAARFQAIARAEQFTPLDYYLAEYHSQYPLTEKTKFEQRRMIKRLIAWDSTLSLQTFGKKTASRYCADGMTFTSHYATKNKTITLLSSYWTWLVVKGYAEENPWRGQSFKPPSTSNEKTRPKQERPFSDDELVRLLNGPASPRLADAMRIAALSGMRIDEIASLRVGDCQAGFFNIRSAKTESGVRRVPIHSTLAAIVQRRCRDKDRDQHLIHELGPERVGSLSARADPLGKQFGYYRKTVKVHDEVDGQRRSLVNFHSFRRWFATQAEQAGQPPWVIETVVGHKRTGMTLGTYSAGPSDAQLRTCVEAVKLPRCAK